MESTILEYLFLNTIMFACVKISQICITWLTPVILALKKLKSQDWHEIEISLGYIVNSKPVWATEWDSISGYNNNNTHVQTNSKQTNKRN